MVLYNKRTTIYSKGLILFLFFFISSLKSCNAQHIFHVDDYGAKPNGKFDNTESFNKCIVAALEVNNSRVKFGEGKYLCQGRINVKFRNNHRIIIQGNAGTIIEFANVDLDRGFLIKGNENQPSIGSVVLENFKIIGPELGKGDQNKFYNTVRHLYGIGISNIKNVSINNVEVVRFYGNGIDVSNKLSRGDSFSCKFQYVEINNCKILDTWGKSPTDSYGDGIYLADCNKFQIFNNIIKNSLHDAWTPGRGGIVIEDFTSNGIIQKNIVVGYERGVHIENSKGNIDVYSNSLIDNRIGIYLWSQGIDKLEKPIAIYANKFSLRGVLNNTKLKFSEDNFVYVVLLRQKQLSKRDHLYNNDFLLNSKIRDNMAAVKESKFLSMNKNRFRR